MTTQGMVRPVGIVGHGGNGSSADEGAAHFAGAKRFGVATIPLARHRHGRESLVVRRGRKDGLAAAGVVVRDVDIFPPRRRTTAFPANLGNSPRWIRPPKRIVLGPRRRLPIEGAILLPRRATTLHGKGQKTIGRPMDLLVDSASPVAFVVVERKGAVRERKERVGAPNPIPLVAPPRRPPPPPKPVRLGE